ncbi:hypothetical protein DFH06DRAFT_1332101 [Mycena polygramma]|nr:hypothetical protein DFH06DRAFT_1332101 [Mycena polygramma]
MLPDCSPRVLLALHPSSSRSTPRPRPDAGPTHPYPDGFSLDRYARKMLLAGDVEAEKLQAKTTHDHPQTRERERERGQHAQALLWTEGTGFQFAEGATSASFAHFFLTIYTGYSYILPPSRIALLAG